jgi:DNA-3-methyladenine glycosylase I
MLTLEGAQAGLSWITILRKRDNYRRAFDNFDIARVARYTPARIERLMQDPGIVRNRLKINAAVTNAKAVLEIQKEFGSFDLLLWQFVGGRPLRNDGKVIAMRRRKRPSPTRCRRRSPHVAASSSARRSCMRSCRRSAWSTITKRCHRRSR